LRNACAIVQLRIAQNGTESVAVARGSKHMPWHKGYQLGMVKLLN
jgi:hypothetical protein